MRHAWIALPILVALTHVAPAGAQQNVYQPQSQPLQSGGAMGYPVQPVQPQQLSVDQQPPQRVTLRERLDPVRLVPPLNINTALKDRFAEVPEIGIDSADSIVKNRPYHSVEELDRRRIIPHILYLRLLGSLTY